MNIKKFLEEFTRVGGNILTASLIGLIVQPFNNWFMVGMFSGVFIMLISAMFLEE